MKGIMSIILIVTLSVALCGCDHREKGLEVDINLDEFGSVLISENPDTFAFQVIDTHHVEGYFEITTVDLAIEITHTAPMEYEPLNENDLYKFITALDTFLNDVDELDQLDNDLIYGLISRCNITLTKDSETIMISFITDMNGEIGSSFISYDNGEVSTRLYVDSEQGIDYRDIQELIDQYAQGDFNESIYVFVYSVIDVLCVAYQCVFRVCMVFEHDLYNDTPCHFSVNGDPYVDIKDGLYCEFTI